MRYDMGMAPDDIDKRTLYYILGMDDAAKKAHAKAEAEDAIWRTLDGLRMADHAAGPDVTGLALVARAFRRAEDGFVATFGGNNERARDAWRSAVDGLITKAHVIGASPNAVDATVLHVEEWLRAVHAPKHTGEKPTTRQPKTKHGRAATPGRDRNRATKARLMRGKA